MIILRVFECPEGMQIETFDGSQCDPTIGGFEVAITARETSPPFPGTLTTQGAIHVGPQLRWTDLPFGTYLFRVTELPEGREGFFIPRETGAEGSAATGYTFSIDEDEPVFELKVYTFTAGPVG
jgi:hypothetical protein